MARDVPAPCAPRWGVCSVRAVRHNIVAMGDRDHFDEVGRERIAHDNRIPRAWQGEFPSPPGHQAMPTLDRCASPDGPKRYT